MTGEAKENVDGDDPVLDILHKATQPMIASNPQEEKLYQERLQSFHASTYYAKPACVSPIFCANFGWRNADQNMLQCSSCSSALAILPIPPELSLSSTDKLCQAYRKKIVTHHRQDCPFWKSQIYWEKIMEVSVDDSVVPFYLAASLSQDSIRIMEHRTPAHLLRKIVQDIQAVIVLGSGSSKDGRCISTAWEYPKLQVPNEIQQFAATLISCSSRGDDDDHDPSSFLGTKDESVLALAILGWKPIEKTTIKVSSSLDPIVSLKCPLCMAIMELELKAKTNNDNDKDTASRTIIGRPLKRPRRQNVATQLYNPLGSHRYYCPMVCGFPSSIIVTTKQQPQQQYYSSNNSPVWKRILDRLVQEEQRQRQSLHPRKHNPINTPKNTEMSEHDDNNHWMIDEHGNDDQEEKNIRKVMDESVARVRKLLRGGISPAPALELSLEDK